MRDEIAPVQDVCDDNKPVRLDTSTLKAISETPAKTKIGVGPVSIEATLPKWAVAILSVLVLIGLTGAGIFIGYKKVQEVKAQAAKNEAKVRADAQVEIERQRNSVLVPKDDMAVYQEQAIHATDHLEDKEDIAQRLHQDGSILIHHYYKDGCVHVVRYGTSGAVQDQKWIFGPHHRFNTSDTPKPLDKSSTEISNQDATSLPVDLEGMSRHSFQRAVLIENSDSTLSGNAVRGGRVMKAGFQGRCMDPHPGTFQFQNQQINQCVVRVDRLFQDGCSHFQLYYACNGMWDVLPNGAAKVTWTRCLH